MDALGVRLHVKTVTTISCKEKAVQSYLLYIEFQGPNAEKP